MSYFMCKVVKNSAAGCGQDDLQRGTLLFSCLVVSGSFMTPWTVAHQASLTIEFSKQEYWSGLPFPTSGGLRDPETEPMSPTCPALAGRFFTNEPLGKLTCKDGMFLSRRTFFFFVIHAERNIWEIYIVREWEDRKQMLQKFINW